MQETNNFTNLTRLSSFLLLDMLLLIDMTWNMHLSAKNRERKRNVFGDREIDKRRVDRQKTQILNDAWPNRVQTYAEGSAWSVAVACLSWTSPSETPEAQQGAPLHSHFSNDTLRFQEDHLSSRTGQAFFFFCFISFLFSFSFFFLFLVFFFFWNATAYFAQFAIRGYAPVLPILKIPPSTKLRLNFLSLKPLFYNPKN